jgi:hypothetical protein
MQWSDRNENLFKMQKLKKSLDDTKSKKCEVRPSFFNPAKVSTIDGNPEKRADANELGNQTGIAPLGSG